MQLTKHFSLYEFRCRCGCGREQDWVEECLKTAEILEMLRTRINNTGDYLRYRKQLPDDTLGELSITVNCGVRCPEQNIAVGSKAKRSKHLSTCYEGAADTWVRGLPVTLWGRECSKEFPGCILYLKKKIVHVDRRTGGNYLAVDGRPVKSIMEA